MRYVIVRDDDTNALTPVTCLERLYQPFLAHGLPVNLATIPCVSTSATRPNGAAEGFLCFKNGAANGHVPIGASAQLLAYLKDNPGYHIVQHGLHHDPCEFDRDSAAELHRRLSEGTRFLVEAGLPRPETFVAPHDRLSRQGLQAVSDRFAVISTGWYELSRLPLSWWPRYLVKRCRRKPHWRVANTMLLSHPGCLLSRYRPYHTALADIQVLLNRQRLLVLVTHWWEYFPAGAPDTDFIATLHSVAEWLAQARDVRVLRFSDIATGAIQLN